MGNPLWKAKKLKNFSILVEKSEKTCRMIEEERRFRGQRFPLGIADPFSAMLQAIPVGKAKRGDRRFNNIGGRV